MVIDLQIFEALLIDLQIFGSEDLRREAAEYRVSFGFLLASVSSCPTKASSQELFGRLG